MGTSSRISQSQRIGQTTYRFFQLLYRGRVKEDSQGKRIRPQ